MTDQRNSASSSHREQARSLFSARKVALMASVVTGLAVYGFSSSSDRFDIFGSVAHAQVSSCRVQRRPAHRLCRCGGAGEAVGDLGQGHDEGQG